MNQTIRKELLAQLQHLRTETREISRLYVANLQRDIVQLIEFLNETEGEPAARSRPAKREPEGAKAQAIDPLLSQMKETLDSLNVKPEKGRRKDLRRIEQAVRSMRKLVLSNKKDD